MKHCNPFLSSFLVYCQSSLEPSFHLGAHHLMSQVMIALTHHSSASGAIGSLWKALLSIGTLLYISSLFNPHSHLPLYSSLDYWFLHLSGTWFLCQVLWLHYSVINFTMSRFLNFLSQSFLPAFDRPHHPCLRSGLLNMIYGYSTLSWINPTTIISQQWSHHLIPCTTTVGLGHTARCCLAMEWTGSGHSELLLVVICCPCDTCGEVNLESLKLQKLQNSLVVAIVHENP